MTHKTKWLLFAPAGLLLVGTGASMVHWAGGLKDKGRPTREWIGAGTLALAVLNAGLSIFGHAVAENVLYQLREKPLEQEDSFDELIDANNVGLL